MTPWSVWLIRPGPTRLMHTNAIPPSTRHAPNNSASRSSFPSPFCSVRIAVPSFTSGVMSRSNWSFDVDLSVTTTKSAPGIRRGSS